MEVESKPVNESGDNPGDKKEEMTSADYYFDRYVQGFTYRRVRRGPIGPRFSKLW